MDTPGAEQPQKLTVATAGGTPPDLSSITAPFFRDCALLPAAGHLSAPGRQADRRGRLAARLAAGLRGQGQDARPAARGGGAGLVVQQEPAGRPGAPPADEAGRPGQGGLPAAGGDGATPDREPGRRPGLRPLRHPRLVGRADLRLRLRRAVPGSRPHPLPAGLAPGHRRAWSTPTTWSERAGRPRARRRGDLRAGGHGGHGPAERRPRPEPAPGRPHGAQWDTGPVVQPGPAHR